MYLKKFLNQPNVVGTVLIVLLIGAGFIYAFAFDGFNGKTAVGGDVDAWLAQMSSGNCGGTEDTPPESPTPDTPEEDDGEQNDPDDGGGGGGNDDIVSGYEDFDWDNLDMKDTSTWPSLPSGGTYGTSGTYTIGQPSRDKPRERGEKSIWDANGGEWRPEKPAVYSDGLKKPGHWNYKPSPGASSLWINVDSSGEEIEGI